MKTNSNFDAWNIKTVNLKTVTVEELLLNLVGWAVLAPSSHNVQPWRFRLYPESRAIEICLPETGILKHSDKKGRQACISIGCALENMATSAEYYGLEAVVQYYPDNFYPLPLAKLVFSQSSQGLKEKDLAILEAMKSRRMNRGKFDSLQSVPKDLIDTIKMVVRRKHRDLALNIITDIPTKFIIAETQYLADRAVIALNDFRAELSQFFLPNDTDKSVGMPGNTFGLNDEMSKYAHEELRKSGSFDPDLAFGMAASGRDGLKSSPLIGVISISKDSPFWWIKAGMAFEGIALEAEIRGFSIAVHAAIVEVEMFNRILKVRLGQKYRPTVIFRLGHAKEGRPHAPRLMAREVSEIIHSSAGVGHETK